MQYFLAPAKWDTDGVREDLRDYVAGTLGDSDAVLVVDETGDLKKGTATGRGTPPLCPPPTVQTRERVIITIVQWWQTLIAIAGGLLLLWLGLLAALWITGRRTGDPTSWREAIRLLPDVIRLLRRLTADPDLPRGIRVRLGLLLGYLLLPIDLVPDFIPVIGYADDAIVVALALRAVVRRAGPDALARHWPGTPTGLATLHRLAHLPGAPGH